MSKAIDDLKRELKAGWPGTLYVERGKFLSLFGQKIYHGRVAEEYTKDEENGVVFSIDSGKSVRIPYSKIAGRMRDKSPEEIEKILQLGWTGEIILNRGSIEGTVTGLYERGFILAQQRFSKGKRKYNYREVATSDIVNVKEGGVVKVIGSEKEEAQRYIQRKKLKPRP